MNIKLKQISIILFATACLNFQNFATLNAATPKTVSSLPSSKLTAAEAVNKGSAALFHAKGIKATFSISSNGKSGNGTLQTKGKKFVIESPVGSSWYNGTSLYSYNPRTKETTLIRPSADELAQANPLSYIHANKAYQAKDVSLKGNKRVVELIPYEKNSGIKTILLTLNSETCLPETLKITLSNGASSTITIKELQLDAYPDAKAFEYPKNKFPGVQVIDLR